MESVLPKLKKKISSYISNETGRISKQSILTIGAFVGTAAIATLATTKTVKAGLTATLNPTEGNPVTVRGNHSNHASHEQSCGEGCGQSCGQGCGGGENGCDATCMASCQSSDMACGVQDMGPCGEPAPTQPPPSHTSGCSATCQVHCQSHAETGLPDPCNCQSGECGQCPSGLQPT